MQSASTAVKDTLKKSLAVTASPRITVEWNWNRYATVSTIDNWGTNTEAINAFDPDIYPISSIVEPLRPTTGIYIGKTSEGWTTDTFTDQPNASRTYTASPDNKYKHWTSQTQAGNTANGGGGFTIDNTQASPYLVYSALVWTNKIYLCFEQSYAKPVVYNIDTTVDGTTWVTVATNVVPNADGTVVLYRQANNSWSSTQYQANPTQLKGLRVVCSSMSRTFSYLNVIEMGLRLEDDLSPFLVDYTVDMEMSDSDFVSPMGVISANTGTVTLANYDGRFNDLPPSGTDTTPLYRGLIDANAKVTIDLGIDSSSFGGSGVEYLRQATMFSDSWVTDDETSVINLKDASKFLQQLKPNSTLMQSATPGKAIWRILDSVGYNNWAYSRHPAEAANKISFYWTDETKTVWDHIQEICQEAQLAAYFDEFGVFQIKTQGKFFDFGQINTPVWTLDDTLNGTKQPDVISVTETGQVEANEIIVHYKPTALAVDSQDNPIQEVVWQPDSDVVLRSSQLAQNMDSSQLYFYLNKNDAPYWPFEGIVNIRGELIKYKGKQYRYSDVNNTWQTKVIYSTDEKLHVDNDLSSATLGYQNYFTGKMIVVERGHDWTTGASHDINLSTWYTAGPAFGGIGGSQTAWNGGMNLLRAQSLVRITGRSSWDTGTFYEMPHGQVFAQPPNNIGIRFRFPSSGRGAVQQGGIFIHSNAGMNSMYLVDIVSTNYRDNVDTTRNEVRIIKRDSGALTPLNGKGQSIDISQDVWYDLDITISGNTISVFIDGHLVANVTDNSLTTTAKCGMYIRGHTVMDTEYFYYASGANWPNVDTDNSSYLDLIRGGYYSEQHYKDGFFRTREAKRKMGNRTTTYKQKYNQRYFDEFGFLVHEVRPYDVKFDKGPCVYSDLYVSNMHQVVILDFIPTPFGANFVIANASRDNAIVQGEDSVTLHSKDKTIHQKMIIFGRTIQQQAEKTVKKKNTNAIRARGNVTLDISSDWIQSKDHADALGDWIANNWSTPADELDVEVFGNPLFEISDLIGLNYTRKNLTSSTGQYFVTKISHSYEEGGLSTSLTLRRARNPIF